MGVAIIGHPQELSFLPPCVFWGLNSGCELWRQALLPTGTLVRLELRSLTFFLCCGLDSVQSTFLFSQLSFLERECLVGAIVCWKYVSAF